MSPALSRVKSGPTEDSVPVLLKPHTACTRELPKSRKALSLGCTIWILFK